MDKTKELNYLKIQLSDLTSLMDITETFDSQTEYEDFSFRRKKVEQEIAKIEKEIPKTTKEVKKYWFCFSFRGDFKDGGAGVASYYAGFLTKKITEKRIEDSKINLGMKENTVLMSLSYLGFMSRSEFSG